MEKISNKKNIVELAMHYRQIVILIVSCLVAFGIYGLQKVNKNEFPNFTVRQRLVIAAYPGGSVSDVEQQVTKPLEDYIFTYKEVDKTKTKSFTRNGLAIIQIELNKSIDDEEKDNFWSRIKDGLKTFKAQLPAGVVALQVQDDFGDTSALLITMESTDKTYHEFHFGLFQALLCHDRRRCGVHIGRRGADAEIATKAHAHSRTQPVCRGNILAYRLVT